MAGRGMREKALYLSFSYLLDDCFERVIKIEGGGGRKKEKRGRKEKTKREKKKERREKKKKERDEEVRECL